MPVLKLYSTEEWAIKSSIFILNDINNFIQKSGICNLMLTGGVTAEKIYLEWSKNPEFPFSKINFYFGDERCVSPLDINSNYYMAKNSLFKNKKIEKFNVFRIKVELDNADYIISDYAKILPEKVDILLLGLGLDGHIASLFPKSKDLFENTLDLVAVINDNIEFKRISITPKIISTSLSIYLLANGAEKGKVLKKILDINTNIFNYPVCLVKDRTWLIDDQVLIELNKN
jgi:6-phosphogluconolactonase